MTIPLLDYAPSSQNQRVMGFELGSDEKAIPSLQGNDVTNVIWSAYRQVFNEQQILQHHRQRELESQLRFGQISVRQFIRGLVLSESFRRLNYDSNNNYRFAEMCIQRLWGRSVYNYQEKLAWSIVLATQGIEGFVDALLSNGEYLEHFGEDTVPYQRRRVLPQRDRGDVSFAHTARYGRPYLQMMRSLGNFRGSGNGVLDKSANVYRVVIFAVPVLALLLLLATLAVSLS
ncbi:MAG: phycobilisome rod-core linker polypeptide [Cyanobacteria bacterium P01_G01_bin.54]